LSTSSITSHVTTSPSSFMTSSPSTLPPSFT
jgi:hypothetical protein